MCVWSDVHKDLARHQNVTSEYFVPKRTVGEMRGYKCVHCSNSFPSLNQTTKHEVICRKKRHCSENHVGIFNSQAWWYIEARTLLNMLLFSLASARLPDVSTSFIFQCHCVSITSLFTEQSSYKFKVCICICVYIYICVYMRFPCKDTYRYSSRAFSLNRQVQVEYRCRACAQQFANFRTLRAHKLNDHVGRGGALLHRELEWLDQAQDELALTIWRHRNIIIIRRTQHGEWPDTSLQLRLPRR